LTLYNLEDRKLWKITDAVINTRLHGESPMLAIILILLLFGVVRSVLWLVPEVDALSADEQMT
jgi:hypothetical protein